MVLGCAEEAFGDGHLVGYLPGMAGCLARRVAWVAVVAIAPAASMRSVACPPSPMSSTAMAQVALGGCLPLPGCRVAVTLMRTAFSGSG